MVRGVNDNATCPRCGAGFHCGVKEPMPCACGRFTLQPATVQALRERYTGCVCMDCLAQLQADPAAIGATPVDRRREKKPAQP
jgi:hypothetical protein